MFFLAFAKLPLPHWDTARRWLAVNRDKPDRWKSDISKSVDFFNAWFMRFAPTVFRETRVSSTRAVEDAMGWTENLAKITTTVLREHPRLIEMLRMSTCPPLARDRLIGLSGASKDLIVYMERRDALPPRTPPEAFEREAKKLELIAKPFARRS